MASLKTAALTEEVGLSGRGETPLAWPYAWPHVLGCTPVDLGVT